MQGWGDHPGFQHGLWEGELRGTRPGLPVWGGQGGIKYKNSTTNASKMQTRVAHVKVKGGSNKVSDKTARVASVKGNIWDTAKDICMKDRVGRLQGLPMWGGGVEFPREVTSEGWRERTHHPEVSRKCWGMRIENLKKKEFTTGRGEGEPSLGLPLMGYQGNQRWVRKRRKSKT